MRAQRGRCSAPTLPRAAAGPSLNSAQVRGHPVAQGWGNNSLPWGPQGALVEAATARPKHYLVLMPKLFRLPGEAVARRGHRQGGGPVMRVQLPMRFVKVIHPILGYLMRRVDSLEKTLMLGGVEGRRRRGRQRKRWLDGITDSMDMSL